MGIWQSAAAAAVALVAVGAAYLTFSDDWLADSARVALHRKVTWLVGVPALLAVFVLGVPYVYLQATTDPPPPAMSFADLPDLPGADVVATGPTVGSPSTEAPVGDGSTTTLDPGTTTSSTAASGTTTTLGGALDGAWTVGAGTQARYAIDDTVLGQTQRVVGSTKQVTGSMTVTGARVTATKVVVDMRSVRCGCVHDDKYQDLLDTGRYPTSTFELTSPIDLGSLPAEGVVVKVPVSGSMTIHGVTRTVSCTLQAVRQPGRIAVNGVIPVRLQDYDIESPSAGAMGGIGNAAIELLVAFVRT